MMSLNLLCLFACCSLKPSAGFAPPTAGVRAQASFSGSFRYGENQQTAASTTATLSALDTDFEPFEVTTAEQMDAVVAVSATIAAIEQDGIITTIANADASQHAVLNPPRGPKELMTLWQRRLITREDPFSLHKLASIAYSGSGAVILGTAAVRFLQGTETFAVLPESLAPFAFVFGVTNAMMCAASVRMAFLHRRFDLVARNAFLGTAASSLFSGFNFLWTSPYGPDMLNDVSVSQACYGTLVVLNAVFVMDTLLRIPEVVESRRDRKNEEKLEVFSPQFMRDAVGYVLPIAWGLPVVGITGYLFSIAHDRFWYFDHVAMMEQSGGELGILASVCYLQVAASMAASFGSLFVTLRDKKLVSKEQELIGITVFSAPAMIWTVYVTYVFLASL